jgi:tetratricopeptide (TPR) repeat protein
VTIAAAALAGAVYIPSLGNPFVYDDAINIVKNASIRRLANFPSFFTRAETATSNESYVVVYRPLSTVSYAFDYAIGKLRPRGYILHNLFLHALAAAACASFARALSGSSWVAAAAGIVFALHPVQTEPVNWATGRATLLFSLFYLLSLCLYLAAARAAGRGRPWLLWSLSWLAAAAALLSKEMAVTLAGGILLIEWLLPPDPSASWKRRLARAAPYAAMTALYVVIRAIVVGGAAVRQDYWGGSPWKTLQVMGRVMARYGQLLAFPVNQNVQHAIPIPERWWDAASLAGFLLVTGALAAALWLVRRRPAEAFGLLWIGMVLFPVSNIIPFYGLIAERHLYLAVAGLGLWVGAILVRLLRLEAPAGTAGEEGRAGAASWRMRAAGALLAVLGAAYGAATLARSRVWSDEILLWEDTVAKSPSKLKAHANLGLAYLRQNRMEEARAAFERALEIHPRSAAAHANLGLMHLMRNDPGRAVEELRQALEANPRHLDAHRHLSGAYLRLSRFAEAEQAARQGLAIRDDPDIRSALAAALSRQGRSEEAERELSLILDRDPQHADALRQLGLLRHRAGRSDEALELYRKALSVEPSPDLFYNVAMIRMERGEYAAAAEALARARAMAPGLAELALRQAQAEIARDLQGRVRPEEVQALRTQDAAGHGAASALLRALPDPAGIATRLAPAVELRGSAEARAAVIATLALLERTQGRTAEARARYEALLAAGGEPSAVHLAIGEMAAQEGDHAAAELHLRKALEIKPRLPQAWARLGFLARLRGQADAALDFYQRALAAAPGHEPSLDGRCEALFDLGRWGEARTCFEARVASRPDHPEAHYYLGRLYQRQGQSEKAQAEFSRHQQIRSAAAAARGDTAASLE